MSFEVKIIADSLNLANQERIITYQLKYPRYIHAEVMTHRVFSRNASSSRAIPVAKLAQIALDEMVEPIRWGKNQPGMQALEGNLQGKELILAKDLWRGAAEHCAEAAKKLSELGLHKQWANRMLEWFSDINVVLTATEWDNWDALRRHPDAQPEIFNLADKMYFAKLESKPETLHPGNWHLPYITKEELNEHTQVNMMERLARMSSARCARVSYLTHDGKVPSVEADLKLFDRLAGSVPAHMSPLEHAAIACPDQDCWHANFQGWQSYRNLYEQETLGTLATRN